MPTKSHSVVRLRLLSKFSRKREEWGVYDTMSAPEFVKPSSTHVPAGLNAQKYTARGGVDVGEVTLEVGYRDGVFCTPAGRGLTYSEAHRALRSQCSAGVTAWIIDQPLDNDDNPMGSPDVYVGRLVKVSPHQGAKSGDPEVKLLKVTVDCSGDVG